MVTVFGAGSFAKAASVGANTVKEPLPDRVSTRSVALSAATSVEKAPSLLVASFESELGRSMTSPLPIKARSKKKLVDNERLYRRLGLSTGAAPSSLIIDAEVVMKDAGGAILARELAAKPALDMALRLGEASGAVLALLKQRNVSVTALALYATSSRLLRLGPRLMTQVPADGDPRHRRLIP